MRQRQQFIRLRTQLKNQAPHLVSADGQKQHRQILAALAKQIATGDRRIAALAAQDPQLHARAQRLRSAPSPRHGPAQLRGPIVSAALPELGSHSGEKAAALAGVAPEACDSGPAMGARRLAGGRSEVRGALSMAALTARRQDGVLKAFYEALLARGKKPLVALTAVMRKLIVLLNRLLKNPSFQLQTT